MDKKEIFDRIEYVVACVGAFRPAVSALKYAGIRIFAPFYRHRFPSRLLCRRAYPSIDDAVSDLQVILPTGRRQDMIRLYHGSNVFLRL